MKKGIFTLILSLPFPIAILLALIIPNFGVPWFVVIPFFALTIISFIFGIRGHKKTKNTFFTSSIIINSISLIFVIISIIKYLIEITTPVSL